VGRHLGDPALPDVGEVFAAFYLAYEKDRLGGACTADDFDIRPIAPGNELESDFRRLVEPVWRR